MRRRGLAIGGLMGVGKSTVGRRVAALAGLPFVDTDAVLEARFGPIPEQLEDEPTFRAREEAVVAEVCARPAVVATGGGAWVSAESRRRLRAAGDTVVLEAPLDILRSRLGDGAGRPLAARLAELARSRAAVYADAGHHVDAVGTPDEVAARVLAAVDPVRVCPVDVQPAYEVCLARTFHGLPAALARAGLVGRHLAVVTDERVAPHWLDAAARALAPVAASVRSVVVPGGEAHKNVQTWRRIVDGLLSGPFDRSSVVVALGGGVVGDLAGFAAASALRGVDWVLLPTTTLAIVDSSVGGKTGFNHARGKNLIGAFHQPRLVYAATDTLSTLPDREVVAGLGEAVKAAVIGDPLLFELLGARADDVRRGAPDVLHEVIARAVAVKAAVVSEDVLERGRRVVLNLGHTVAHGLEAALGYGTLAHGEAVAIGMVSEARWAEDAGISEIPGLADRLSVVCAGLGLPVDVPEVDPARVLEAMRLDKKGRGDSLRVPVPRRLGDVVVVDLSATRLAELLRKS